MTKIVIVETTVASYETAKVIAMDIIERRLAACCQITPSVTSAYSWQEKIETAEECLLRCKTVEETLPLLLSHIQSVHPYQIPELISYPADCRNREYFSWMRSVMKGPSS